MKRTFWRREHEKYSDSPVDGGDDPHRDEYVRPRLGRAQRRKCEPLLEESQVNDYVDGAVLREIPTGFSCPELDGKYFLVTGTGKYFKNVQYAPEINLGLVRLTDGGETAQLLWGFADGGKFTSEFPAHMMSHAERLKVDPQNRVVMHCHPANLLAMTYVHMLDEKQFTRTLWQMCTECIVVFPDGVNVLPWMLAARTRSVRPPLRRCAPPGLLSGRSMASTAREKTSTRRSASSRPPKRQRKFT